MGNDAADAWQGFDAAMRDLGWCAYQLTDGRTLRRPAGNGAALHICCMFGDTDAIVICGVQFGRGDIAAVDINSGSTTVPCFADPHANEFDCWDATVKQM